MLRIITLLLFICLAFGSFAQDTLRFNQTIYSIELDTISNRNFTLSDSIYLSPQSHILTDSVTFLARVNDSLLTNPNRFNAIIAAPSDTFYPGVFKSVNFNFNNDTSPPFVVGTNIVVIWPVYNGGNGAGTGYVGHTDSLTVNATYHPLGLADAPLAKMFIYQINQHLNINFGDAENIVQQVRIYDIEGQMLYSDIPQNSHNIPTAAWQKGVYLCEVNTKAGDKRVFKFLLSE